MPLNIQTLSSQWSDYELLDSGDRLKLERFADVVVTRSEPKAWWKPARKNLWRESVARYIDDDKKNRALGVPRESQCAGAAFGQDKFSH